MRDLIDQTAEETFVKKIGRENINNRTDMETFRNEDVILYMDDLSGTNIILQPVRTRGTGKLGLIGASAGTSQNPRDANNAAALLETDNNPRRNRPPDYGPEIDDLVPAVNRRNNRNDGNDGEDRGTEDGSVTPTSRYPRRRFPFDVNIYQQKKTLAQGMMDLALLSANANQFRYVLQSTAHPYFLASLGMIGTSLFLQIIVGIGLIWNSTFNVKKDTHAVRANKVNNLTVIGIFIVTILNVFITSFGVAEPTVKDLVNGGLKIDDGSSAAETLNGN